MNKLQAPKTGFRVYDEPLIQVINNVLSLEECQHIIDIAKPHLEDAVVSDVNNGVKSEGRTGSVHWVKHDTTQLIRQIIDRISAMVGISSSHAESLQVIYYAETQQYKPHFDAYDLNTDVGKRCTANGGQRMVTALIYLNEVEGGGGTIFPKAGCRIESRVGRAVIFHNCYDGSNTRHPSSLHGGMPVEKGEKWACNLWYRENTRS